MKNDALFLERVAISNFRAYPPDFELSLPAGAGVTVLSGPNGLGKTSLFEAIEWALTGDVKRLSTLTKNRLDGRYLLRRDSGTSCEVSLVLTGGTNIRRLQTVGKAVTVVGTELDDVAAAIRVSDSRWKVSGQNVSDYLHLTHFHPQAAELRLVSEKPGDRWLRISPLAGADRFDRFRSNLRNVRSGLTKIIGDRQAAVTLAKERKQRWAQRVDQLKTLTAVDRAKHGALSPRETLALLVPVESLLRVKDRSIDDISSEAVAKRISDLKEELERAIVAASSEEARVRALADLPSAWTSGRATYASALDQRTKAHARVLDATERAAEADGTAKRRLEEFGRAAAQSLHADQRHRLAASLMAQENDVERVSAQLPALASQRSRLEVALAASQAEVDRQAAVQQQAQADDGARRALDDLIKSLQAARLGLAESRDLDAQLEQQRQRLAQKTTQLESLRSAYHALENELRGARAERSLILGRLDAEASRLGELAQAVATIAAHLSEHDETCPVCKSEFSKRGELRRLALLQAAGPSAAVAALQLDLQTAERNITYLEARSRELETQLRATDLEIASVTSIVTKLDARIASLRSGPMFAPLEGVDERLSASVLAREAELRVVSARIGSAPSEQERTAALSTARQALAQAARDLDVNRAQAARLTAELSELAAKNQHARKLLELAPSTSVEEVVPRLAQEFASLEAQRISAAESANEAKAVYEVTLQDVGNAQQLDARLVAEVARIEGGISAMLGRWRQSGLPDEPSESALQNALLSLAANQAALAEGLPTLATAAAGLEDWQRLDMTRALEAELGAEARDNSLEEYAGTLEAAVAQAHKQLAAVNSAQSVSDKLAVAVRDIGEDFGDSAIAPFGDVFKGFLRALVRDSRFHRVNPEYARVQGGGNVLRFNLALGESVAAGSFQVEMVLSEGQLSEVSLAAMLAASCMYPWSRWRGVLLDDPTQYQDLTHCSSLFEVIRNLAVDAGFQVVVAVHDRAQADFLVRKLESSRVPYIECEYLAMGPHGAVTRVRGSAVRG